MDDINRRLSELKGEQKTADDRELEERLAKLKDIDPRRYSAPPITVFKPVKPLSQSEQTDSLLKQMMDQVSIEESVAFDTRPPLRRHTSTDDEIASRLAKLRDESNAAATRRDMDIPEDVDSDEEADIVASRLVAESKLPRIPSDLKIGRQEEPEEPEEDSELPWCVICNEDAKIRCLDCSNDLYCLECFKDFHDDRELKKHKTRSFHKTSRPSF